MRNSNVNISKLDTIFCSKLISWAKPFNYHFGLRNFSGGECDDCEVGDDQCGDGGVDDGATAV